MANGWDRIFVDYSCDKLQQLSDRICTCLDLLQNEQIWYRGSENENAVGNLVLHLSGNVRQWIGSALGGRPDTRERDREFAARSGAAPADLKENLRSAVAEGVAVIRGLSQQRLLLPVTIQGYEVPGLQAVYHVVEHFSGHAGQIMLLTKHFTHQDLGFYSHLKSSAPQHADKGPGPKIIP